MRNAGFSLALAYIVAATAASVTAQTSGATESPQSEAEKVLGDKIGAAVTQCAAAYVDHRITTHADSVICANGPITKAFQEARFPDMDLVFEFEAAALDAASKLDHGQSTESDFRVGLAQAMLRMKAEEVQRAETRNQQLAAEQRSQMAAAQAEADEQRIESQRERELRAAQRQAAIRQLVQDQQIRAQIEQQNAAAFMSSISNLMGSRRAPMNCTTMYSGAVATTNCN